MMDALSVLSEPEQVSDISADGSARVSVDVGHFFLQEAFAALQERDPLAIYKAKISLNRPAGVIFSRPVFPSLAC